MRVFLLACLTAGATGAALAQELEFPQAAVTDTAVLSQTMPALARTLLHTYADSDRVTYLTNAFRIQAVAGRYADSRTTLAPNCTNLLNETEDAVETEKRFQDGTKYFSVKD